MTPLSHKGRSWPLHFIQVQSLLETAWELALPVLQTASILCHRAASVCVEDAERRMPYLLCSHDNTLQSSSCELPRLPHRTRQRAQAPTFNPDNASSFNYQKAFSKEERSVWNSGILIVRAEVLSSPPSRHRENGWVCHSCCTLLLGNVIRNDFGLAPGTILFSSLVLLHI